AANVDFTAATEAITGNAAEAMAGLDFTEGAGVLKTGLESSVTEAISAPDISAAKESLRTALSSGITEAINSVDLSAAYAALTALRQALETRAQATLGAQMTIQIPVNLTYNYNVTNPTPPKPTVTAQALTMNTTAHADGGFVNGAELSWVGEDGPEAIIPLGAKRRGRGLELYEQVGEILGVAKNAEGGIYNSRSYVSTSSYTGGTRNAQYIQRTGAVYDNRETQTDISHVLQSNPISYVGNTLNSSALSYGNAYSAGDTLNSSALSYGNAYSAGDTLNRSALSYGNAYTAGDSYTELSQAGQGSYYADTLPMLSPERATAYDAQEGTGAAFEAGVGQYPATTAESDREDARGQDGAFPPLSDDTDQDTEGDGGGGFSGTVNNQPTVIIHVNVNPHFQIDGSGGQSASELEAMVRRCIKEMTDDIGGELAERLIPVFQNMPMGGAG
ncbi:MAG: hypothetical protein IJT31_08910, partial [Oscillibacter sp.]|nr:hypothetical protein [Oscillibacter sp.]